MRLLACLSLLLLGLATAAPAQTARFVRTVEIEGERFALPMQLFLTVEGADIVLVTLTADLTAVQARLPALLSRTEDGCDATTRVDLTAVRAEGREVTLDGRAAVTRYLCIGDRRLGQVLSQAATVRVRLGGRVEDGCLRLGVRALDLAPEGTTGALLDATGLTERLTASLRDRIDRALGEGACVTLAPELLAFDAVVSGGSLREIGTGGLGAVLHARLTVTAENFVRLIGTLADTGALSD